MFLRAGLQDQGFERLQRLAAPYRGDAAFEEAYWEMLRAQGWVGGEPGTQPGEAFSVGALRPDGNALALWRNGTLVLREGPGAGLERRIPSPEGACEALHWHQDQIEALFRTGLGLEWWAHSLAQEEGWKLRSRWQTEEDFLALDLGSKRILVGGREPALHSLMGETTWLRFPAPEYPEDVFLRARAGAISPAGDEVTLILDTHRGGVPAPEGYFARFDARTGNSLDLQSLPLRDLTRVAYRLDGTLLVLGLLPEGRATAPLWSQDPQGSERRQLGGPPVNQFSLREGGRLLGLGRNLIQWDLTSGALTEAYPCSGSFHSSRAAAGAPRALLLGEKSFQILDLGSRELVLEPRGAGESLEDAAFLASGSTLVTRDRNWVMRSWDWPRGTLGTVRPCWPCELELARLGSLSLGWGHDAIRFQVLRRWLLSGFATTDLWDLDRAGGSFLVASVFGEVRLFQGRTGRDRWQVSVPGSQVLLARLDPEAGTVWIYTESNGRLVRLSLEDGEEQAAWMLPRPTGEHHPSARVVLHREGHGGIFLLRGAAYALAPRGGQFRVLQPAEEGAVQLALSPDQRILARLFPDGTISWKEFETESTLGRVTPEDPAVRRILFSPCGKELLYSQGRHLRVIPLGQELVW